jgi:hypothetical protein
MKFEKQLRSKQHDQNLKTSKAERVAADSCQHWIPRAADVS